MDPILSRLGDVTIQRLEKPKRPPLPKPDDVEIQKIEKGKDKEKEEKKVLQREPSREPSYIRGPVETDIINSKRTISYSDEMIAKRTKFDDSEYLENKSNPFDERPEFEDHMFNDFSDEEITDFETESEFESDGEIGETNEIINPVSGEVKTNEIKEEVEETETDAEGEPVGESADPEFFEKLVEETGKTEGPSTSQPAIKEEEPANDSEDYEYDIKQKLKEMGEISFETVKKEDKPKKSEVATETEVSVMPAKKSGDEEVTIERKGGVNMRRNIREVMDEAKLDESTLAAQRQEMERLRRVQEQQRIIREVQRQVAQERMQNKVLSLLQGNKPGTSGAKIGNTVLVKLPNGETKPMTRIAKRPFDLVRIPKPSNIPKPANRSLVSMRRPSNSGQLTPSVSIAPVNKKPAPLFKQPPEEAEYDSSRYIKPPPKQKHRDPDRPGVPTIDLSSDDDCIVLSESDGEHEEVEEDPSNSGMHTNDEFNQPDEQGRVVVNIGHPEGEQDIYLAPQIARIIKPHQIGGIRFMYDNVVESINRFETSSGFGCILAHSMGLGKTLQVVSFSDVFLRHTTAKTILCIMPINTLQNWLAEYNMWLPTEENAVNSPLQAYGEVRPRTFNLHVLNDSHKTLSARAKVIHEWRSGGGVLLIGYEQFRLLSQRKHPRSRSRRKPNPIKDAEDEDKNRKLFDDVHEALVRPGPDLVICDEGHRIKNSHASISQALKQMRTKRRIVLTGYPLQNSLMEYWCMVDFVRPNYLGTKSEFCNMFERPIQNGQCIDSTEADIKLMRYRAHVLHSLLVGFVQRRSHAVLQTALPQKEEYVLLVRMTPFQRKLYNTFMNDVVRVQSVPNPLKAFAVCCKIWNHPDVLYNFLKKRAGGEAVDIDLEEVQTNADGTPNTNSKIKKGTPKRNNSSRSKKAGTKPAASITPYSQNDNSKPNSQKKGKGGNQLNIPGENQQLSGQNQQRNINFNQQPSTGNFACQTINQQNIPMEQSQNQISSSNQMSFSNFVANNPGTFVNTTPDFNKTQYQAVSSPTNNNQPVHKLDQSQQFHSFGDNSSSFSPDNSNFFKTPQNDQQNQNFTNSYPLQQSTQNYQDYQPGVQNQNFQAFPNQQSPNTTNIQSQNFSQFSNLQQQQSIQNNETFQNQPQQQSTNTYTDPNTLQNQPGSFANQQNNFTNPQNNYLNQQTSFSNQQGTFPSPQSNFANQQNTFLNQQNNFPNQQSNFQNQQGSVPNQTTNFPAQQGNILVQSNNFSNQPGNFTKQQANLPSQPNLGTVNSQLGTLSIQQSGFPNQQANITNQQTNLPTQQPNFQNQQISIQSQQNNYTNQQQSNFNNIKNDLMNQSNKTTNQQSTFPNQIQQVRTFSNNFSEDNNFINQNPNQKANYGNISQPIENFQNQDFSTCDNQNSFSSFPKPNNQGFSYDAEHSSSNSNFVRFEQSNWGQQNINYEQKPSYFTNFQTPAQTGGNSANSWIKKEDDIKPKIINSPIKSENSNSSIEHKPKINIISDIKIGNVFSGTSCIPESKKINILSDVKLEIKKEETLEEKYQPPLQFGQNNYQQIGEVKTEKFQQIGSLDVKKEEIKDEIVEEDEIKVNNDSPPISKLRDVKDDGIPYDWAVELLKDYVPGIIENSAKMEILFCIIRESITLGDRLLLFSQSLITLDLIEQFLQSNNVPGETHNWAKNANYYRLDGSTSALEREKLINEFNSNSKIYLFLVSTRAGSLGINLIGANRVVVLDASWNPCHDTQAVCRVYRYGQRKPCFVYRLVMDHCLEKKIYDRQINKQGMSDRVVDECNPDANLTMKDVSSLCFDDKEEVEEKDWSSVKENYIDIVLQKVLEQYGRRLNKEPFQHESLLVDRKEKQLSQQEKRLAKKGYEREKQASRQPAFQPGSRSHRPVASVRPMQQGGERVSRWIPAEHWQRQGMTAQEMILPLDVVIPTSQPDKGNIVLKAGQKVLVLKSPKGVYMQLENGKIVAIKTAIKVRGKAEDNEAAKAGAVKSNFPPSKTHPMMPNLPQKRPPRPPLSHGVNAPTKLNVRSIRQTVPNLVSRIQSVNRKINVAKTKPYQIGQEIVKGVGMSKDSELSSPTPVSPQQQLMQQQYRQSQQQSKIGSEDYARLQRHNFSFGEKPEVNSKVIKFQSRGDVQITKVPPVKAKIAPRSSTATENRGDVTSTTTTTKAAIGSAIEQLEQSTSQMINEATQRIQDISEMTQSSSYSEEEPDQEPPPESESANEESFGMSETEELEAPEELEDEFENDPEQEHEHPTTGDVEEQPKPEHQQQQQQQQQQPPPPEYHAGYGNYYAYGNIQPYPHPHPPPPPPQGYAAYGPPQHPPYEMMAYPQPPHQQPPQYNYAVYPQGYPQYAPPPGAPPYDYGAPPPHPPPQPMYAYPAPYPPQQYAPPPPQGPYPPAAPPPPPNYDYQYQNPPPHGQPPPASTPYYQNS
ncbi:uncharacterized protein LOC108744551 isoform X2 [Agrilus planipennis]|uniref:Uncharacterized protein LOC108744551 isoform X2 n=1 Tax=Agrilus planipennis TaxID=224129 RepID=A0A1W4XSX1_AGRPL|nr:uncharacterized protein LOC108744551 isoform X2 [Agrilus planipennis]